MTKIINIDKNTLSWQLRDLERLINTGIEIIQNAIDETKIEAPIDESTWEAVDDAFDWWRDLAVDIGKAARKYPDANIPTKQLLPLNKKVREAEKHVSLEHSLHRAYEPLTEALKYALSFKKDFTRCIKKNVDNTL